MLLQLGYKKNRFVSSIFGNGNETKQNGNENSRKSYDSSIFSKENVDSHLFNPNDIDESQQFKAIARQCG